MYSQGSYNPYQQPPPGLPPPPLPPPPHFQQVPPVAVPPHIAQPGPPMYQHGPPPANKSYLHPPPPPPPPPPAPLPHMYPTAQQNSQYPSHLGTQNVHHILQSLPPPPPPPPSSLGTPRPDMLQAPPPSRVLPPPPASQGQTLYRAPVLPPPPLPPTSSFLTSSQFGNLVQSTSGNSHLPSLAPPPPPPPPPPSSPPPVPPSPPPISSTSLLNASYNSDSNRVSGSKLRTSDFVDKAVALIQDGHKPPVRDGGTSDSPLRPLGIESSKQPDHMITAGGSHSPLDSDMEMEGQSN